MDGELSETWIAPGRGLMQSPDRASTRSAFLRTWPRKNEEHKPFDMTLQPRKEWSEGFGAEEARRRDVTRTQMRYSPRSFQNRPFNSEATARTWRETTHLEEAEAVRHIGRRKYNDVATALTGDQLREEMSWSYVKKDYREKSYVLRAVRTCFASLLRPPPPPSRSREPPPPLSPVSSAVASGLTFS